MDRARPLPVQHPAEPAEPVRDRRALHQAGEDRRGRGDEHGDEVAELLQAVVARPAFLGGKRERQILQRGRRRVGEHLPGRRHQPQPLVGREQQNVEDDAVDHPEQGDREMPPPGKTDGMANARDAEPAGQRDCIVLGGPDPSRGTAFWKRNHSVPGVQSRFQYSRGWSARICTPARTMNVMKNRFRKCMQPQPSREARADRRSRCRDAGIAQQEFLDCRHLPQRLRQRHAQNQQPEGERQGPQHVDPAPADADLGRHAGLRRQPVAQANAIVCRAEACGDGVVRLVQPAAPLSRR